MMMRITCALLLVVVVLVSLGDALRPPVNLPMKKTVHYPPKSYNPLAKFSRFLAPTSGSISTVNMSGNVLPVGVYWVNISLGTPFQNGFEVAVDSGSTDLLVPGYGCDGCHLENENVYDISLSSTGSDVFCGGSYRCKACDDRNQCHFINSYETCNLTDLTQLCTAAGPLYNDVFSIGPFLGKNTTFGCITEQTKNFQQFFVVDGVIGLAFPDASSWGGVSIMDVLFDEGQLAYDMFSICLDEDNGGVLTLGGYDKSFATAAFLNTTLIPVPRSKDQYSLFTINMTNIYIGGKSIGLPITDYADNSLGGCVVDSGTNIFLVPHKIYQAIQNALVAQLCPSGKNPIVPGVCTSTNNLFTGSCFAYTQAELNSFPPMDLDIDGVILEGTNLLVQANSTAPYCYAIRDSGVGAAGILIIGDTTMAGYYVAFDRANKVMGWAPANKQKCHNF